MAVYVSFDAYRKYFVPKKRKRFVIDEMRHCLITRQPVLGHELTNYCRNILDNIADNSSMTDDFNQTYTYGEHTITVHWVTQSGKLEFLSSPGYNVLARIHYPGE